jgi:uncharacterized protein (DUF302 family)
MKFMFVFLALVIAAPASASDGIVTKPSTFSVKDTISRFAAAVKSRAAAGFIVFTEIDHAAAGKNAGIEMRPRTVIVFGNPKLGTPVMAKTPLLAIDNPLKALVWEDDQGKVWLSYNSADYLYKTIYPRHGLETPASYAAVAKTLNDITDEATK